MIAIRFQETKLGSGRTGLQNVRGLTGGSEVEHDVIKIVNLRVNQCNFNNNLKVINFITNRLLKIIIRIPNPLEHQIKIDPRVCDKIFAFQFGNYTLVVDLLAVFVSPTRTIGAAGALFCKLVGFAVTRRIWSCPPATGSDQGSIWQAICIHFNILHLFTENQAMTCR